MSTKLRDDRMPVLVLGWINRTVNRSRYLRRHHLLRLPAGLLDLGDYGLLETVQCWREKPPDKNFIVVHDLIASAARADAIDANDVEVSLHVQWMREPYGIPDTERPPGLNATLLQRAARVCGLGQFARAATRRHARGYLAACA